MANKLFEKKEASIERTFDDIARADGWKVRKVTSPRRRAALDKYYLKAGRSVWIEWKKPGKEPTALQWEEINDILAHGGEAYWTNNIAAAKIILRIK